MKADRHHIAGSIHPRETIAWLSKFGYRGAVGVPMDLGIDAGVLYSRPNEPVMLAMMGETLRYDKRRNVVVVESVES